MKKTGKNDLEILNKLDVVVDLTLLRDQFGHYKNPVKKIHDLIERKSLHLLRRGQYLNLKSEALKLSQVETWAQQMYSPSYISCEWALQYYGLLTDRVTTITSVCLLKTVKFKTPVGNFSFEHIHKKRYPVGYKLEKTFFIARAEKALLDFINLRVNKVKWSSAEDIAEFLEDDLRLKTKALIKMASLKDLEEHISFYNRNSKEARVLKYLISLKKKAK